MTPEERREKRKRVKAIKRQRLGQAPIKKPRTKTIRTTRRKDKDNHLWITDPICPLEKIRTATGEVDGLHWLQMEAERWGAGVEIKPVHDGKMVLVRRRA